jgi:hypothetical protein
MSGCMGGCLQANEARQVSHFKSKGAELVTSNVMVMAEEN